MPDFTIFQRFLSIKQSHHNNTVIRGKKVVITGNWRFRSHCEGFSPWQSHKVIIRRFIPCLWDFHVGTLSLLEMTRK